MPHGTLPISRKAAYPTKNDVSSSDESPRSDDNSEFPKPGSQRMIMGLKARPELNGQIGLIQNAHPAKGRVELRLISGEIVLVKPENLLAKGALRTMFQKQMLMEDSAPSPPSQPIPEISPQPISPPPNVVESAAGPSGIQSQPSQSSPSASQLPTDSSSLTPAASLQEPSRPEPLPKRRPSQTFPKPSPEFYDSKKFVSTTKHSVMSSKRFLFFFAIFSLIILMRFLSKQNQHVHVEFKRELLTTPL